MEEDFPRGKRLKLEEKINKAVEAETHESKDEEKDLFPELCQRPKEKKKLRQLRKAALKEDEKKSLAELATPGMLVLGCVAEVRDFELVVSLPNGFRGTVGITHICDAYTSLLEQLANSEEISPEDNVAGLDQLFYVGQVVRCKILSVISKASKTSAILSLNPKDVNTEVKVVKSGLVLTGCVASCEDHGYVVDLGVTQVCAFLRHDDAAKYTDAVGEDRGRLCVGSYLHCMISTTDHLDIASGQGRAVNVIIEPRIVHRSIVTEQMKVKLHSLLPGMVVNATVTKVSNETVTVKFLSYIGSIQQLHLLAAITKYQPQQQVTVAILFVNPTTKVVTLSELTHIVTPDLAPIKLFGSVTIGQVIDEALVIKAQNKHGVYLQLPGKLKGFAGLADVSELAAKKVNAAFLKGSTYRCRVIGLELVDRTVHVSLKKSVIEQPFFTYSDIQPATLLTCKVKGLHPGGVSVYVARGIYGLIPRIHLAEVLLQHPELKFKAGKTLMCKVLSVDASKSRLILTHKKSLIESKLPVVMTYSDCRPGLVTEGCVVSVKSQGIVIVFYNNVKGFAPRRELSESLVDYPEKLFYIGQTVKCRVLNCEPNKEKLFLSLRVGRSGKTGKLSVESATDTATVIPVDWTVGKVTDCRVIKVKDGGLEVELTTNNIRAFLPRVHLSDHVTNYDVLLKTFHEGDHIEQVMYIGKSPSVIVTRKHSLIQAAISNSLVTDFSHLKPGMLGVGMLKRKMPYGVFVDMLNGLTGLAPNKFLTDRRIEDASSLFEEGQTLAVKVTEVDQSKQRFLVSLRSADIYHGDVNIGLELVSDYLSEYRLAINRAKTNHTYVNCHLAELTVGQVVMATVTKVTSDGILCELTDGVKAFATVEHMPGVVCKVGESCEAVVLHLDLLANCAQLTLNKDTLKAVHGLRDNKFTKVRPGQLMKSEVQLITNDFVLVLLKGHAAGRFAYLPAKRHLNDLSEKLEYSVTQVNNTVIKRVEEEAIFAILEIHEQKAMTVTEGVGSEMEHQGSVGELPAVGTVTTARIVKIYDFQMNVSVNRCAGRVHITEVTDDLEMAVNPLEKFTVGSEIKIKVIGYRTLKANKNLSGRTQTLVECSTKLSKLLSSAVESEKELKVGDEIVAYVLSYSHNLFVMQLTPKKRGRLHILNVSDDVHVLETAVSCWKVGTGHKVKVTGFTGRDHDAELTGVDREELRPGLIVPGLVLGVVSSRGLHVQLPSHQVGDAHFTDLTDDYIDHPEAKYQLNQFIKCCIIAPLAAVRHKWAVSLRPSRVNINWQSTCGQIVDCEVSSIDQLNVGDVLRGFVVSAGSIGVLVSFSSTIVGKVQHGRLSKFFFNDLSVVFPPGKVVTAKILSLDRQKQHVSVSLLEEDTGCPESIPEQFVKFPRNPVDMKSEPGSETSLSSNKMTDGKVRKSRKRKKVDEIAVNSANTVENSPSEKTDEGNRDQTVAKSLKKRDKKRKAETECEKGKKGTETLQAKANKKQNDYMKDAITEDNTKTLADSDKPRLSVSVPFSWHSTFKLPTSVAANNDSDSDDSGFDCTEKTPKRKRHKKGDSQEEEKKLFEAEMRLLDPSNEPQTDDEFARLVLQSPHSSLCWLRYVAFKVTTTDFDGARAVFDKALNIIPASEEQECMNLWTAYLNFENLYGSQSRVDHILKQAQLKVDPVAIQRQLCDIYAHSGKADSAAEMYKSLLRRVKLRADINIWLGYAALLFTTNKLDDARKLYQQALNSLEPKLHVEMARKFAQLEFKFGSVERGKTLFETLITTLPRRTDVWSVYIDVCIKYGDIDQARSLFDRVTSLSLPAKRVKFLFDRYLKFESCYGTEDTTAAVRQKALNYVQSNID